MYSGYELPPLIKGKLVKRYKRFLADIELEIGSKNLRAHPSGPDAGR